MNFTHLVALFSLSAQLWSCHSKQEAGHLHDIPPGSVDSVFTYSPNRMVRNVKKSRNGSILLAASFGGVFRSDGTSFTKLTGVLGPRRFWDVLEDRDGNVWITTTDSGVYRYDGRSFRHFTTRDGLAGNGVGPVYEDKAGMLWFGTDRGVSRYDGATFRNFTKKDGLIDGPQTILQDNGGNMWFGTRGETYVYDGNKFTVVKNAEGKPFSNVWSIIEDRNGHIWIGGSIISRQEGKTRYVIQGVWRSNGPVFQEVSRKGASAMTEDRNGNIWTTGAVNPNGVGAWTLSRYDFDSLYTARPVVTEIMSAERMLCGIVEAADGSIWFGSMNGVYRYDGQTVKNLRSKEDQ